MATKKQTVTGALALSAMCIGILANWGGAATRITAIWPAVQALLPLLAIGGIAASTVTIAGVLFAAWKKVSPSAKLGSLEENLWKIRQGLVNDVENQRLSQENGEILTILSSDLEEEFGIPCPPVNEQYREVWAKFLFALSLQARRRSIEGAQAIWPNNKWRPLPPPPPRNRYRALTTHGSADPGPGNG